MFHLKERYFYKAVTAIIIIAVLHVILPPSTMLLNISHSEQPVLTFDVCKSPSGFISANSAMIAIPENYFCFQCVNIESSIISAEVNTIPQVYLPFPEKPPRIA